MNRYADVKLFKTLNNNLRNEGLTYRNSARYPIAPQQENDIYAITEWGDRFES